MNEEKSVYEVLSAINVNGHTEKKNGLTFLAWAFAWDAVKKNFPDATYNIYENNLGWNYHTDGKTCWVKTSVTICGSEMVEYLPVMDFKNASIPLDKVTSFDVNKAIQRALTKACARHGLGLYIYAGEDLPISEQEADEKKPISEAILKEAESLHIQLEKVAVYRKKAVEDLTDEDVKVCIDMKKAQQAKIEAAQQAKKEEPQK